MIGLALSLGLPGGEAPLSAAPAPPARLRANPPRPVPCPSPPQIPARAHDRRLEVADGADGWRPFFVKGVNLGAAIPGRHPSEFPDRATYDGWIREMAEAGFNTIRVYTIHPPAFYEALRAYNLGARKPMRLIHGVWAELPPGHDFLDPAWLAAWHREMRDVAEVLHGRARIPARPGHASGTYDADVSPWTLAVILGREWESSSVVAFNRQHPGVSTWTGRFVTVREGQAMERFLAQSMDHFLAEEWDRFQAQRPIAFTNWPTLDPLFHITESTEQEERALQRKLGMAVEAPNPDPEDEDEDAASLDMEKFEGTADLRAGLFASYHAYPYYPDFMDLDPGYAQARDHLGPSHYAGYLADLVRHHTRHPVLIAEFGVPSSRIVAHWQPQGMTHGGQDEREQGEQDARLQRDIYDAGCAGGVLFAWIDEWFKRNWLTLPFEGSPDRKPFWYNPMDAEENYGLIAYRPGAGGPSILIDGKADDWAGIPAYLGGRGLSLKVVADEGWLHLGLFLPRPADFSKEAIIVGLDTVDARRGDHRLPWTEGPRSEAGLEVVVLFQGPDHTGVFVDAPYAIPDYRPLPRHSYQSVANEAGRFLLPTAKSNHPRIGRDGTRFPGHTTEIGWLRQGTQDRADPAFDSRAEWQAGRGPGGQGFIEARIPWTLLQVTDPSRRMVLDDPGGKTAGPLESSKSTGFRFVLAILDADKPLGEGPSTLRLTLPDAVHGTIPVPPLYTWPAWSRPTFHRFRKLSFAIYQKALAATPDEPRMLR